MAHGSSEVRSTLSRSQAMRFWQQEGLEGQVRSPLPALRLRRLVTCFYRLDFEMLGYVPAAGPCGPAGRSSGVSG